MTNPNSPKPGSTPDDATDLHDNPNPHANSSPRVDLSGDTGSHFAPFGSGAPGQYYLNPTAAGGDNPNRDGAGLDPSDSTAAADNIAAGLDSLYADVLGSRAVDSRVAGGTDPSAGDVYQDEGFGKSGQGWS